jgi:hypothetical protein
MTYHGRAALSRALTVVFLSTAFASVASAQDVMQLDLMFRDSLLRKTPPESQADHQGQRHDVGTAPESIKVTRRYPRPRRHKKA